MSHPVARNCRNGLSVASRQFATPDPADRWYGHAMKRNAFLCAVLAVACGGNKKDPEREGELGSTMHTSKPGEVHGAAVNDTTSNDPHLKFRKSYVDPGGMWMPSQMTLQQHVDNFTKMGVKLDAKALANPLAEPLAGVVSLGGWPHRDEPSLRAGRTATQLDAGEQPRREWLSREEQGGRAVGGPGAARDGRAGVQGRHQGHAR